MNGCMSWYTCWLDVLVVARWLIVACRLRIDICFLPEEVDCRLLVRCSLTVALLLDAMIVVTRLVAC